MNQETTTETQTRTAEPFQNEPQSDFSRKEVREQFQQALEDVAEELGGEYPLVIAGLMG